MGGKPNSAKDIGPSVEPVPYTGEFATGSTEGLPFFGEKMVLHQDGSFDFTQVPNVILRSKAISFRHKGLLAYLWSKPDGWEFSADRIQAETKDGLKAVERNLRALEKSGHLIRKRFGQGRIDYYLKFNPEEKATKFKQKITDHNDRLRGQSITDRNDRRSERSAIVSVAISNTEEENNTVRKEILIETPSPFREGGDCFPGLPEKIKPEPANNAGINSQPPTVAKLPTVLKADYSPAFDTFWSAYPRKMGKGAAWRAWRAVLRLVSPATIMAGLKTSPRLQGKDPAYIPHPATWLNSHGWEDQGPPVRGFFDHYEDP